MYRLIKKSTNEILRKSKTPPTLDGEPPVGMEADLLWLSEIDDGAPEHDSRIFSAVRSETVDAEAGTVTASYAIVRRAQDEIKATLANILHRKQDDLLPQRSRERLIAACLYEVIAHTWPNLADAPEIIQNGLQVLGAVEANEAWYSTIETKVLAGTVTTSDLDS